MIRDNSQPDSIFLEPLVEKSMLLADFIHSHLQHAGCDSKQQMQLELACEELFINIVNYSQSLALIEVRCTREQNRFIVIISDQGIPFNPLEQADADTRSSIKDRQIGGLGVYLSRKLVDHMEYVRQDGLNVTTLVMHCHR